MTPSPGSNDEEESSLSRVRGRSLMDDMEDEDEDEEESPLARKRPRRNSISVAALSGLQSFCRQGTQFKTILSDAIEKVASATQEAPTNNNNGGNVAVDALSVPSEQPPSLLVDLVREKTAQCILLQQDLQHVQSEKGQLHALNEQLRLVTRQQATRVQKMTTAVQLASQNAAKAREDADTTEATSATLASQLQALQVVVDETKQASRVLLNERREIATTVRKTEEKYVHSQADQAKSKIQQNRLQQDNNSLVENVQTFERQVDDLKTEVASHQSEANEWKQSSSELQALHDNNQQRIQRLEEQLKKAETLLFEASTTAVEAESTAVDLKVSLEQLQEANQKLYAKLNDTTQRALQDKESRLATLQRVQDASKALKLEASGRQDQITQLTAENRSHQKEHSILLDKIAKLEHRLKEANNLGPIESSTVSDSQLPFVIPPLGKENGTIAGKCSICFKDAVGKMHRCQCGKHGCKNRAHATCVNKIRAGPSVSHPGTPAPRLPVILCATKTLYTTLAASKL